MSKRSTRKGHLVVLSGPAGVGKTTVVQRLLATTGAWTRSISATTRAPRGSEQDGRDYFFYTRERFEEGIRRGEFLEHALIHGNYYGTPMRPLEKAVDSGQVVILAIDVQGAQSLRNLGRSFYGIFIMPPSLEELRRRLAGRGDTSPADLERRLAWASEEMTHRSSYDAVVVNETLDKTVEQILRLLKGRQLL